MNLDDATAQRCIICPRQLRDHEAGRFICLPCEHRIDADLRQLAGPGGLYARLCLRNRPGRSGGDGPAVSGTPGQGIPGNGNVLNLIANGGIVSDLETWVEDWATYGLATVGYGGRLQFRIDTAVETLRLNLTRAASKHPALDEFAREIFKIRRQAQTLVDGERQPRRVRVTCPCGQPLAFTLDVLSLNCPRCQQQHGHSDLLDLPLAERSAA